MTQFNTTTYDIERPGGTCAVSGRELEPGEKFFAVLIELTPEEIAARLAQLKGKDGKVDKKQDAAAALGFRRLDISADAWGSFERPETMFSFWKSTVPHPNEKKKMFVDDAVLLNLFTRLADTDDAGRLAFRFVLALILIRKKVLRYDRTDRREETVAVTDEETGESHAEQQMREYWLVTPKLDLSKGPLGKWNDDAQGDVLNPQLGDEEIEQVTDQLSEILEAEL